MDECERPIYQCLMFDVNRRSTHSLGTIAFVSADIKNTFPSEALRRFVDSITFINGIHELPSTLLSAIKKGGLVFWEVGLTVQTVEGNESVPHFSIVQKPIVRGIKVTSDKTSRSNRLSKPSETSASVIGALDAENATFFEHLIRHRVDIRNEDGKSGTLLHLGVERADGIMMEALLRYGAHIDAGRLADGLTPLHLGAQYGHAHIVRLLLEKGARLEAVGKKGETPLFVAAENGRSEVVSVLFEEFGANINTQLTKCDNLLVSVGYSSPLCAAVVHEHCKVIDLLLSYGADTTVNYSRLDKEKCRNLLMVALLTKNANVFKQVFKHLPDVSEEDRRRIVFEALYQRGKESSLIVEFLLRSNFIRPNDSLDFDLLNLAIYNDYLNIVQRLIEFGAKVNECKNVKPSLRRCKEYTPMHTAARYASVDMLNLLLQNGADINSKCCHDATPIIDAVEFSNYEAVKLLLERNASICDIPGLIALAVKKRSYYVVNSLLQKGGDANDTTSAGEPSVKIAASYCGKEIFELLKNYGADIHAKNREGKSVLHEASEKGALEIVQIILKNGGDKAVNDGDGLQNTPLMYAAENGHEKVVDLLLKHHALVELHNKNGRTALYFSAWRGHDNIVKTLLKHDANINPCDFKGETPLRLAVAEGKIEVVETLLKNGAPVDYHTLNLAVSVQQKSLKSVVRMDVSMVNILLKFGHRIDCSKKSNNTFLHLISRHCNASYLQSILDHCFLNDISVIKSLINQFRIHYPTYLQRGPNEEYGWDDVIEIHLIKVSAAGFCSDVENSAAICQRIQSKRSEYFQRCSAEIESMQNTPVANTCVSFFDILNGTEYQMATYARNSCIRESFNSNSYRSQFPVYAGNLAYHFEKGLLRKELVDRGFEILRQVSPQPDVTLLKILKYLNNSDLRSLIRARGILNV